jgi:hypothetical protein
MYVRACPLAASAADVPRSIAGDHLDDMTARALTKGIIRTGDSGTVASWKLDEFDEVRCVHASSRGTAADPRT